MPTPKKREQVALPQHGVAVCRRLGPSGWWWPRYNTQTCVDPVWERGPFVRGIFITLEGTDGCGKSTQASLLVKRLNECLPDVKFVREPGGSNISEKVRALLLDPQNDEMADECELLLYEASRAQLVREVLEPALECGTCIVCDRYFDSTTAYQSGGRGIPENIVRAANELGSCGLVPDRTIVFDLDPGLAFSRATTDGADRMEAAGLAFQQRVRASYLRVAEAEPERVRIVDASGSVDEVFSRVVCELKDLIPSIDGGAA